MTKGKGIPLPFTTFGGSMKDASHHPKKLQKKILRETRKETNHLNGKGKEGAVAMSIDYNPNGFRSLPRNV
jgi:hypothetical protein